MMEIERCRFDIVTGACEVIAFGFFWFFFFTKRKLKHLLEVEQI